MHFFCLFWQNSSLSQPSAKRPKLEHSYDYVNMQTSAPVQLSSALPPAPPLPSLVLCDPLLVAYYQALASSRFNFGGSTYPPSLLPLVSNLPPNTDEKNYSNLQPPLSSAVQEAAAALLKLAPQSAKDVGVQMESKIKWFITIVFLFVFAWFLFIYVFCFPRQTKYVSETCAPCVEPLKKHILHRSQSQQNVAEDILRRQISSTKDASIGQLEEGILLKIVAILRLTDSWTITRVWM